MNNKGHYFFTSESVSEGHPDKVADQISDAVLDACLAKDSASRVACETLVTTQTIIVAGEITTKAHLDVPAISKNVIRDIGYIDPALGFDPEHCTVTVALHTQSPDIAMGVNRDGAGDQGMMFGYATRETPELMPLPIMLAHKLIIKLTQLRKQGKIKYLRPDSKSQVTVEYCDGKPCRVDAIVISTQHDPDVKQAVIKNDIINQLIKQVIPAKFLDKRTKIHVNPTGQFIIGGPHGDTGLTGRKIIVDTYGGMGRHGGGAFSGKDPSKVDRSAAYMARYVAKNIVAARLAECCEVQLSYAIGVAQPTSVMVNTFGTGIIPEEKIAQIVKENFKLTPRGIIEHLKLRRPVYRKTATNGHFGNSSYAWEKTDQIKALQAAAAKYIKK